MTTSKLIAYLEEWSVEVSRNSTYVADLMRESASRLRELHDATRWRPISEAPKDGTLVDVFIEDRDENRREIDVYYCQANQAWGKDGVCGFMRFGFVPLEPQPTHFMPAPPAPDHIVEANKMVERKEAADGQ